MTLLDRFRTQARDKHSDPVVRLAFVEELPIDDRGLLAEIARTDEDARVRRAAAAKLLDPEALAAVLAGEREDTVRTAALGMLRDLALEAFEGAGEAESLAAVDALTDAKTLAAVAKGATRESSALRAVSRVSDIRTLGSIARHAVLEPVRAAALAALTDHAEVLVVAMNSDFKDTALAALQRVSERVELEQVATSARNKSAAKRARGILREIDDRAAAEAASAVAIGPPPDPDRLARIERLEVLQRLEALDGSDQAPAVQSALDDADARWASLAGGDDAELTVGFVTATTALRGRLADLRAREVEQDAARAEADRLRAEAEAEARAKAAAAALQEAERRHVRLAELAAEAVLAAADADVSSARRRLTLVRREWSDLAAGIEVDAQLEARVAEAEAGVQARDAETQEANARLRREALERLKQLAARVEALGARSDLSLKAGERALRDLRTALADVPPLPSRNDFEDITSRLKAAQATLTPRVHEMREAEDWKRFANLSVQEQLCARMDELRALQDPEEIAHQIRELQQQWRQAAEVPRGQGEALWRRFKATHDELWLRCEAYFAEQAQARAGNLASKIALCERAESLAESTDWIRTADEIKRLQAEWKTVGPVTRGQEKAIWERFRAPCDRFFTRRQADLSERKATWAANLGAKEALCVRVEALSTSTDWDAAAAEIRKLQADWKTIGPVKKSRSEAIWQRFRAACDTFFSRYSQRHDTARAERVAAREALCAELDALVPAGEDGPSDAPPDLVATVRGIRSRWQQEIAARGVDRDRAIALDQRFQTSFAAVVSRWPAVFGGTDLDPDANRKRMETLVRRVEDLAASLLRAGAAADPSLSPTTRLAAMLKEALAANTIGGKVDDDSRYRAAADEVRQAQASWLRLGPVPEEARRALGDRFQRACRRIADVTAAHGHRAGAPGRQGR